MTFRPPGPLPAWLAPFLPLSLRHLWDRPEHLVQPLLRPGDWVLEVCPGSACFTFPMARAVGPAGQVTCVASQTTVLARLREGAERQGLAQVDVRRGVEGDLQVRDLEGLVDLAVAIDVLHRAPDPAGTFRQMISALRPGGRLLLREPVGRFLTPIFKAERAWGLRAGLCLEAAPWALGPHAQIALFRKEDPAAKADSRRAPAWNGPGV
jgi:ubiquinone/menaquinone biosynthesis C-methylase UbiE